MLIIVAVILLAVILAAAAWFILGRESAREVGSDDAVAAFRAENDPSATTTGRGIPKAGVYEATVSGTESIGLPGFDENFGPTAPVTVTHANNGCFVYRVDLNNHHWRSWTLCPTATARWGITQLDGWTARNAPGFDLSTFNTYVCHPPTDVLWDNPTPGDPERTGACTGTSDLDDAVTADAVRVEVIGRESLTIGGAEVATIQIRTTDTFSSAQTGNEVANWWFDVDRGLPVRLRFDANLTGSHGDYRERADLTLTTMKPAT